VKRNVLDLMIIRNTILEIFELRIVFRCHSQVIPCVLDCTL
jgi:hypothetical protein